MEQEIIESVTKRNKILDDIIQLNHVAISNFQDLSEEDLSHFLLTRKYLIEALVHVENQVIAESMMNWTSFKLNEDFKPYYVRLSQEKKEKTYQLYEQDQVLQHLMTEDKSGNFHVA